MASSTASIEEDTTPVAVSPRLTTSYQSLDTISGHDRSYLNDAIFGEDVRGKSVLDIGTFHGYFCLEALNRGAARAVGLEPYAESVAIAKNIAAAQCLPAEYIECDFDDWATDETFDVILCLNVLHHMLDPIHAIRRMMKMAREKIVLEVAVPTWKDRKFGVGLLSYLSFTSPAIFSGSTACSSRAYERTFMFTPTAIKTLFDGQASGFEPVEIWRSPHKGRYVAVARKRKIKHLTVIAGPTAAGKTTFYNSLTAEMRGRLGIPLKDDHHIAADAIGSLPKGNHDHVVLHYDMLRPFDRGIRSHDRDIAAGIIDVAEKVTFLTIVASRERLKQQISTSEIDGHRKPSKRHLKIRSLYDDPNFLQLWYQSWLRFTARHKRTAQSYLVQNEGGYELKPFTIQNIVRALG